MNTICIFIRTFVYTFVSFDRAHGFLYVPLSLPLLLHLPFVVVTVVIFVVRVQNCMQNFKCMLSTHTHTNSHYNRMVLRLMSNIEFDDCFCLFCCFANVGPNILVFFIQNLGNWALFRFGNRSNQFYFKKKKKSHARTPRQVYIDTLWKTILSWKLHRTDHNCIFLRMWPI